MRSNIASKLPWWWPTITLAANTLLAVSVVHAQPFDTDSIWWRGHRVDGVAPSDLAQQAAALGLPAEPPVSRYFIQLVGPITTEMKAVVTEAGCALLTYVPRNTYIVRMDSAARSRVQALPDVLQVIPFAPQYRVAPNLLRSLADVDPLAGNQAVGQPQLAQLDSEAALEGDLNLTVLIFADADLNGVVQAVEALGAEVLVQVQGERRSKLRIRIGREYIAELAQIDGVMWIEEYVLPVLHNDAARGVIQDAPVWAPPNNLRGEGQIVAVADGGLDSGVDDAGMHDDLEGSTVDIFSWPVQPLAGILNVGADDGAGDLDNGHGTHVAASVLGDGALSNGIYRGAAPEAMLVFQAMEQLTRTALFDKYLLTGLPVNLEDLFQQAYDVGARIHTNSWGSLSNLGSYTALSEEVDQFVWDHPDMLILYAAGNSGVDADGDNRVDSDSISPPGTAKNALTVGASENDRPAVTQTYPGYGNGNTIDGDRTTDNPAGLAAFSSRGPTDDGRIKPDLVAPGTMVVSARSQAAPNRVWITDDMESGDDGWEATGTWAQANGIGHDGTVAWHDSPAGNYPNNADMALTSPIWDIQDGDLGGKQLQFRCRFDLGDGDRVQIRFSDDGGVSWTTIYTLAGTQTDWELITLPLDVPPRVAFSHAPQFQVHFDLEADADGEMGDGVFIDDLRIVEGVFGHSLLSDQGLAAAGSLTNEAYVMMSGTSMATPITAGAAAVVRQYVTDELGMTDVSAAMLRAAMINGAADISPGQYGTGATEEITPSPDNNQGWGRVDLANSLLPEAPVEVELVDELTGLETNDVRSYTVPVADTGVGVVITLVYHDFPGAGLVNDLDLTVEAPDGGLWYPNGGAGPDRNNNVEQVLVPAGQVQLGDYQVSVRAENVPEGPQPYSLAMRYGGGSTGHGRPDLSGGVTGPSSAAPGEDIGPLLGLMVQNLGDAPALGTDAADGHGYMVDVVLSTDEVLPQGFAVFLPNFREDVLLRDGRVSHTQTLGAGEQASYPVGAEIPIDTPPGRYCLGINVDPGHRVAEADESNNAVCHWIDVRDAGGTTELTSGEAVTGSVDRGYWAYYRLDVPTSQMTLEAELFGLSDDVDLYVRRGERPTLTSFDCRPYLGGTAEEYCAMEDAGGATWYVGVHGYRGGDFQLRLSSARVLLPGEEAVGSLSQNEWAHYRLEVPASTDEVRFALDGLTDDLDLYVRRGASPTLTSYDCRPYLGGTSPESCRLDANGTTAWYVSVHGYRTGSFRLTGSYSGGVQTLAFGELVTASVGLGQWAYYRVELPASASELWFELYELSADVDLYVRRDSPPTLSTYACRPYLGGTSPENCVIIPGEPATWFVGVQGYQSGSFTVRATTP